MKTESKQASVCDHDSMNTMRKYKPYDKQRAPVERRGSLCPVLRFVPSVNQQNDRIPFPNESGSRSIVSLPKACSHTLSDRRFMQ